MLPTLHLQDCVPQLDAETVRLLPRRVLLMESQPDDALTIQRWVEATGRFDVTVATEYPRGDELLLAEDWALIIIDVHEPTIQDVELVRRARATRAWTPVLLLTASDGDDQLGRMLRISADAVLTGQVTAVDLARHVFDLVHPPDVVAARRDLERGLQQRRLSAVVEPLAASIAHEINNKLAPAVGFAELILYQLDEEPGGRLREYAAAVRDSAEAAAGVVRRLLTVSKPVTAARVSLDLRLVVREALRSARPQLAEAGVQLSLHLPDAPIMVAADAAQVKQVLLSLVYNGIEAMEAAPARTLDVRLEVVHGDAVLEVRDSGHGIDASTLPRIFEPFFTTRGRSGLGLPLSYAAVRQHHGDLSAESEPGEGTLFRVRLPLDRGAWPWASGPRRTVVVPAATASTPSRGGVRVLIVDDDPSVSTLLQEVLGRRSHWTCDVAADGLEAVRLIDLDQSYDLIICDMALPELSGRQLFDWVAARHPHLLARLLFMTGDPTSDMLEAVQRQGARWVAKPFSAPMLLSTCDAVLQANRPH